MPATTKRQPPWPIWVGLGLLLLLALACYWPGLSGGFLFDDFVNLDALGNRGPIDNWPAFWRYITSGTADPTGRPLALLSFLLDAHDWPADPAPFLRTNLLIHLLNGVLLFLLVRQLERPTTGSSPRTTLIPLLTSAIWLLHPLWVSTTLYVVQREAMLPATFTLIGLTLFTAGRQRYLLSDGGRGRLSMTAGIFAGTLLAFACKANGMLVPLLALVLCATVLRAGGAALSLPAVVRLRRWDAVMLWLPTLVIALYLGQFLLRLDVTPGHRPWTIGQRLLTEPRVLLEYLGLLAVPRAITGGLFNDDYPVFVGWLNPLGTLPAIAAVVALIGLAWRVRSRFPRLAAGLLFYFAGHVLESSVIPLELYFEHRNYLPALLLAWPLAWGLLAEGPQRNLRRFAIAALLVLLAATTWQRAKIWGQPGQLAAIWAMNNPDSPRAQANGANQLVAGGRADLAVARLSPLWNTHPLEMQIGLNYINARCEIGGISDDDNAAMTRMLRGSSGSDLLLHQWLSEAIDTAAAGTCRGMNLARVESWIRAGMANPNMTKRGWGEQNFQPLLGEIALRQRDGDQALEHFTIALRSHPNPDFAARLISLLGAANFPQQGMTLLDRFQSMPVSSPPPRAGMGWLHAKIMARQQFWPHEFAVLRAKLQQDIDAMPKDNSP